jgi:hypothetical protein
VNGNTHGTAAAVHSVGMTRPFALMMSLLLTLATQVAAAAGLNEGSVKKLMAAVDQATVTRDVAAIDHYLADEVAIVVILDMGRGPQRVELGKAEYIGMVRDVWAKASDYRYERTNQRIEIKEGRATVTADIVEAVTIGGQQMDTRSHETTIIEMVDGRLQATSVRVTSRAVPTKLSI